MHAAKRHYSTKRKSAKTFLKAFPRKFIPSKYTRYIYSITAQNIIGLEYKYVTDGLFSRLKQYHPRITHFVVCFNYIPTGKLNTAAWQSPEPSQVEWFPV